MTREEFEAIQKAHAKLELRILRLRAQQRMLLERLIGQRVEWPDGYGITAIGTIISCEDGRYLRVLRDNDVRWYAMDPRWLRFVGKEVRGGN